mgnify:CR=1
MEKKFNFGHFSLLTATSALVLLLNACGSGNAAIKAAEDKERAELESTGGKVSAAQGLRLGYACCNLRYSGDWVSDQSSGELPFIPAGTRMLVRGIDGNRADVEADGKPYRLGHDYGRAQEKMAEWVDKLVPLDDPSARLAKYPANIRAAIEAGKLLRGMTKEQVIMALGYPVSSETKSLDAPKWKYYWDRYPVEVFWSSGKISKLEGRPEILAKILASSAAGAAAEAPAKSEGDKRGKSGKRRK